ncbi:MAG: ATPase, T2SS/T4P/T4SS family [Rhodothermales bacterium]
MGDGRPSLQAVLPRSFGKCRLQGFIPPLSEGPSLIIRKPPGRIIPLDEYVEQGVLTKKGRNLVCQAVAEHKNIMVAGPTASGKTTLCNAIIAEIARQFPTERLLILEDTPELRCASNDHLRLRTTDQVTMRHLVKYSLRCTPNRIIIGEVRDGAAKDLLDAWITGHPGGCGTVHGEDPERALQRLLELAREGAGGVAQHRMVAQAVHYLILITGHGARRKVTDVVQVVGSDGSTFELKRARM